MLKTNFLTTVVATEMNYQDDPQAFTCNVYFFFGENWNNLKQNLISYWPASPFIVDISKFIVWRATFFSSCTPLWQWEQTQPLSSPDPDSEEEHLFEKERAGRMYPKIASSTFEHAYIIAKRTCVKTFNSMTYGRPAQLFSIVIQHSAAV